MQTDLKPRSLEEEWESYTGTGITAKRDDDAIALRQAIDGRKYAIVKLIGGCWSDSPMTVVEEINTNNPKVAQQRFTEVAAQLGFEQQPLRGIEQFFVQN